MKNPEKKKLKILAAGDNENQGFSSLQQQKTNKKLKILAAGDIHGDIGLAKKLAEKAEKEHVSARPLLHAQTPYQAD